MSDNNSEINRLIDIVDLLRSENGCPWDKEQTSESLIPFFIEEVYEAVECIENNNDDITDEERRILIFNDTSIIARFGGVSGPVCYFIQHIYIPCAVGTFTFFVIATCTSVYYIFKIISHF